MNYKSINEINPNYKLIEIKPNEYIVVDKKAEINTNNYYIDELKQISKAFKNNAGKNYKTVMKFHFLFYETRETFVSTGVNIYAISLIDAILLFQEEHPEVILLAIFTEDLKKH